MGRTNSPQAAAEHEAAEGLSQFRLERGLRIEVVAAEPLVTAPVAMAFDADGRLFVAEIPGLLEQSTAGEVRQGRVRVLEDKEGEGKFTASTIFAENISWPSSLLCYEGGVFVAATPDIVYFKDTLGFGSADVRRIVYKGFGGAAPASPEGLVGNLRWGPDNRIYGTAAGRGGDITSPMLAGFGPVPLGTANFSFDPRTLTFWLQPGPASTGLGFDSSGTMFVTDSARPLRQTLYETRYAQRNLFFPPAPALLDVAGAGLPHAPGELIVAETNAPPGRSANATPFARLGRARGTLIYTGLSFGTNFLDNAFVADPAAHLVRRLALRREGLVHTASTPNDGTEFLKSSDQLFHPMHLAVGPDGGIYIADLRDGVGGGRIYRVTPAGQKAAKPPQLSKATEVELVADLASTNAWQRETASRLLYEAVEHTSAPRVAAVFKNCRWNVARIQALNTLAGQESLTQILLTNALRSPDDRVREHAVRLSERINQGTISDELWLQLKSLAADPSIRVRYQLAFTLGEIKRADRAPALWQVVRRDAANPWIQTAVLSSAGNSASALLRLAIADPPIAGTAGGQDFLRQLSGMIGLRGQPEEVKAVIDLATARSVDQAMRFLVLGNMADGLRRGGGFIGDADPSSLLKPLYVAALTAAANPNASEGVRLDAVRLAGNSTLTYAQTADLLLLAFTGARSSPALRAAAVAALARQSDPRFLTNLVTRWNALGPALRDQGMEALATRADRVPTVLAALEHGALGAPGASATWVNLLRNYPDPNIRQRASRLFGTGSGDQVTAQHPLQSALLLRGTPSRGRAVFNDRCSTCHLRRGEGWTFGPDLANAAAAGKGALLDGILRPAQHAAAGYGAWLLQTKSGDVFPGRLELEGPDTVVFLDSLNQRAVWRKAAVQSLQAQEWSLMPGGATRGLTSQQLADLLEFLANPDAR